MTCSVAGCDRPHYARGMCNLHWQRTRRTGSTDDPRPTLAERFWAKVDRRGPHECWLWTAATVKGYGRFRVDGATVLAHRWAYEWTLGPVPAGLELDHLCRNRACCNPMHLEPVTRKVNILRGEGASAQNARKSHCPQGHPYTPENTYVNPTSGGRSCRACATARERARVRVR